MRKKFCLLLLTFAACLCCEAQALACSCVGPRPPCQAYGAAAAVFVGTVSGAETRNPSGRDDGPDWWGRRVFKFSVVQTFSGVEGAEAEVWTGSGGGDCGYGFRQGATYLVYAYRDEKSGRLGTNICARTRPVEAAAEDLEFLRGLTGREPGVTISGAVTRVRHRVREGDTQPAGGLAGAALTVEGEGVRRELRADAQGRFSLSGLRPGVYKVRLELPDELTVYRPEEEVRVADRGCAAVSFAVSDNGRLSGALADADGLPAAGVLLTLYEADDPDPTQNYARLERTDDEGRFSFKGLPPGRYRLAVNLTRFPEPGDRTGAFPRTYYPGVPRAEEAEVITLGEGENLRERDWRLPAPRTAVAAVIEVVWADGRPVANADISYRDVTYHDPNLNHGAQADAAGRFTLKGYEGQTYVVEARSNRQTAHSEPLRVTLTHPAAPLRIVINKPR